ncbi:MAG: SH3 domain-containing protein [Treponema sp.]|nr:SH3 domain-containing protein [Treponema sp.]
MILYNDPIKKVKIRDLQRKQEITIKEIVFVDGKETWLKIQIDGKEGYICYSQYIYDPYENNNWMLTETIESGNKIFHVLKCSQSFFVYTNLRMRDKPGLDGNKVGIIEATQKDYAVVKTIEVTEEKETIDGKTERWAKVEYKGITGWVFAGYLDYERGGPRFWTPEFSFEMSLGAGI